MRTVLRHAAAVLAWPAKPWLILLGAIFFIRFPVKFTLDPPSLMDFSVYRAIALRVVASEGWRVYEPLSERMVFKYGPLWALIMGPLGWLSDHAGGVLWTVCGVLALVALGWYADRLCRAAGLKTPGVLLIATVLLLVRPITSAFLLGQTDVLWAALAAGHVWYAVRGRSWPAALCLALAISLKLPALVLMLPLVRQRSWITLGRTLALAAGLNALAAAVLLPAHPSALLTHWAEALRLNGMRYAFDIGNQSLLALFGRLLRPDGYGFNLMSLSDSAVVLVTAAIQTALLALWWFAPVFHQPTPRRLIASAALLTIWMVIFSPSCWVATYSALFFPLMLALAVLTSFPARWRSPLIILSAASVGTFSLLTHAKLWRALGIAHINGESYVYLVLMILPAMGLALTWLLWSQRRLLASPD